MEKFKKNLKTMLKIMLVSAALIVFMYAGIKLTAPAKGANLDELNLELQGVQAEWNGINERQRLYNEFSEQQKRLKEAEANFIRAKIEDVEYQKNVLESRKGVEQVFQQGN